jgi:hypothetical protein
MQYHVSSKMRYVRRSGGGAATNNIAEYALALAASQIILLADLAKAEEDEVPF